MSSNLKSYLALFGFYLVAASSNLWAALPIPDIPPRVAPSFGLQLEPDQISFAGERLKILEKGILELESSGGEIQGMPVTSLTPDVWIFHKAVHTAVSGHQVYDDNEWEWVVEALETGNDRLAQLRSGDISWTHQPGPVVRGYRSEIDDSVQPYALVLPEGFHQRNGKKWRLDVWLHGRDNQLTELKFVTRESRSPGPYSLENGIILKPYGRYCNAFKFAGEVDVLEAVEAVEKLYRIDTSKKLIRGFSMGGAGCWYMASHYPDLWAGAAPGAGFAETFDYQRFSSKSGKPLPEWEQLLWRWTDSTEYALNLSHVPTVAYSGENDSQIQAAEIMESALGTYGIPLRHLIGPGMGHRYHPEVEREIHSIMDRLAERGKPSVPARVRIATSTLRYNRQSWVEILELERHWDRAEVSAKAYPEHARIELDLKNVRRIKLDLQAGESFFEMGRPIEIQVGLVSLVAPATRSDLSWQVYLNNENGSWRVETEDEISYKSSFAQLKKRPGLQGPVDDAFLGGFVFVTPTGEGWSPQLSQWAKNEMMVAAVDWKSQMRGEIPMLLDSEVTESVIQDKNLILWGDPGSNSVIQDIYQQLPLEWDRSRFGFVNIEHPESTVFHPIEEASPVLIFPNPLNPKKYIVINSGFTFANAGSMSNSRQTPKLPDFAVIDLKTGVRDRPEKGILEAGFFNEEWKVNREIPLRYWGKDAAADPQWISFNEANSE